MVLTAMLVQSTLRIPKKTIFYENYWGNFSCHHVLCSFHKHVISPLSILQKRPFVFVYKCKGREKCFIKTNIRDFVFSKMELHKYGIIKLITYNI